MTRKRTLTPEEKLLWKLVNKGTKPFKPQDLAETPEPPAPVLKTPKKLPAKPTEKPPSLKEEKPVIKGNYAGIDKNTAQRFRRGENEIDATLDLHGMTSEKAHRSLIAFIEKQAKKQSRHLLVITGKGSGILRSSLPQWLNAPGISGLILAIDQAQAKHGGSGAYYILLRRKRPNQ